MLCFEVKRNDAQQYTAGINSNCILSAIVTHVDVIDPGPKRRQTLDFLVSGLNSETKQHMNWRRIDLRTGDRIEIRVIESDTADPPVHIAKSQTRKAIVTGALARIRARRKALLSELKNLARDELAYSKGANAKHRIQKPRQNGAKLKRRFSR